MAGPPGHCKAKGSQQGTEREASHWIHLVQLPEPPQKSAVAFPGKDPAPVEVIWPQETFCPGLGQIREKTSE